MLLSVVVEAGPTAAAAAGGFWSRFVVSPGFGGAAAFIGALLVFAVGMIKAIDDRAAERARQWWTAFTWTFDRATTTTSTRLGPELTTVLLARLMEQAHTGLEEEVVTAMTDGLLADPKPPDETLPTDEEAETA